MAEDSRRRRRRELSTSSSSSSSQPAAAAALELPQRMRLPTLAPRPSPPRTSPPSKSNSVIIHRSDAEWAAVYPHIERMYMRERQKLRHVMERMKEEYGFTASVQMYKKRFAKWGFHKNSRRSNPGQTGQQDEALTTRKPGRTAPSRTSSSPSTASGHPPLEFTSSSIPMTFQPGRMDALSMMLFTSIYDWSNSYFERAKAPKLIAPDDGNASAGLLVPTRPTSNFKYDPDHTSYAFQLVAELLNRGQGVLAGRLARKAFLYIEDMLKIEGPSFIWNILETLHHIARLGHGILFDILLRHMMRLAATQEGLDGRHPVTKMLGALWNLSRRDEGPSRVAASTSPGGSPKKLQKLQNLLQQAWLLNANLVIDNFDPRFLLLYHRMSWDSPPAELPRDRMHELDYSQVSLEQKMLAGAALQKFQEADVAIHPGHAQLDNPGDESLLPANYDELSFNTVKALRERGEKKVGSPNSRTRVLSTLLKGRVTETRLAFVLPVASSAPGGQDPDALPKVPRIHARILAHSIKVLAEVDLQVGGDAATAIDRMRTVLSLRDYGQNKTDPVVIWELWRLEALLLQEGREAEAAEVRAKGYERLEQYVSDIPVHLA